MSPSRSPAVRSRLSPVLLCLLVACADPVAAPTMTTSPSVEPPSSAPATPDPATPSPTPDPTPEPTEAAAGPRDVAWGPFTITTPAGWERDQVTTARTFAFVIGLDRWLVFHRPDADTVDAIHAAIAERAVFSLTDAAPVEVGGATGIMFDVLLADDAPADAAELFRDLPWGVWGVERNRPARIWLVDVDGDVVMLTTDAPEAAFANWLTVVEEALATLEWGS